jgi:L-ascorbate metabolism protein UlaG (beta-lactamase superfamily)
VTEGPPTHPQPIWDGRCFHTPNPGLRQQRARDVFKWMAVRRPPRWPRLAIAPRAVEHQRVEGADAVVHWVGHSTLLLQAAGLNVLTDPIWSRSCGPGGWAGPRRLAGPGLAFDALPPIDVVLLSHNHYDHCDIPTLRRLEARDQPLFCVPPGLARLGRRWRATHLAERTWWDAAVWRGARFVAVPAQHFSGRGPTDRGHTLWCGWVMCAGAAGDLLFVGDTGWWEAGYRAIGRAFPGLRLAAIPIGAYNPRWFMGPVHVDPGEAVALFEAVGAEQALGIHHRTFQLTDEPMDEPAERLVEELDRRGIGRDAFRVLEHGASWEL